MLKRIAVFILIQAFFCVNIVFAGGDEARNCMLSASVRMGSDALKEYFLYSSIAQSPVIREWESAGYLTLLKPKQTLLGQDEKKVAGYADRLLFSAEEKKVFDKKGIFIFDIDKTIAKRDMALLEKTRKAIEDLMRAGHLVVIITGQPIDIQRDRVVTPMDAMLRRNLVVISNEGTTVHHFLPDGREYLVKNDFTDKFTFSPAQGRVMEEIVDDFVKSNGFEYADGGEFEKREMAQAAFKLQASLKTREEYARILEKSLKAQGIEGFRGWASGSTTISFLHEDANKRDGGLGFLKNEGFIIDNALYYGDEFFYNGNDAYMLAEDNLYAAIVGRLELEPFEISMPDKTRKKVSLKDRPRTLYLGGGPQATTKFINDFLKVKAELNTDDFQAIMRNVSARNINLEAILTKSLKKIPADNMQFRASSPPAKTIFTQKNAWIKINTAILFNIIMSP